MLLTVD
jgi:hypothetical protein